jgi:hypothetical protein
MVWLYRSPLTSWEAGGAFTVYLLILFLSAFAAATGGSGAFLELTYLTKHNDNLVTHTNLLRLMLFFVSFS